MVKPKLQGLTLKDAMKFLDKNVANQKLKEIPVIRPISLSNGGLTWIMEVVADFGTQIALQVGIFFNILYFCLF